MHTNEIPNNGELEVFDLKGLVVTNRKFSIENLQRCEYGIEANTERGTFKFVLNHKSKNTQRDTRFYSNSFVMQIDRLKDYGYNRKIILSKDDDGNICFELKTASVNNDKDFNELFELDFVKNPIANKIIEYTNFQKTYVKKVKTSTKQNYIHPEWYSETDFDMVNRCEGEIRSGRNLDWDKIGSKNYQENSENENESEIKV